MPYYEGSLPGNPQVAGQYFSSSPYAPKGTLELTDAGWIVARQAPAITYAASAPPAPVATPVTPTFDPKIDANTLYGRPMALYTGGYARMGASPAPIVGPYIHDGVVDFIVSFGVPSNPEGDRKIYKIWLDNELAWSSDTGGTTPGDGTFTGESFDFVFRPGTLTQTACSLETAKFPGDENAYRPQMLLQIIGIPYQRFMENTGKPVPYVAVDIGDVTDGAVPQDGINLGEALERIAFSPWAGYTADSFESVGLTDIVDAILIKDNFTVIQLCQSVTGEYRNIDLLVSDKVRMKDRGAGVAPDFVFDRDSIIAGDEALSVARSNATAQRREHELVAIDPDQDYTAVPSLAKIPRDPMVISAAVGKETATIPLVIDASTRQALATYSQNYDENARRKVAFKVPAVGYEIEPGDLFALSSIATGFDNEVFKCTQATHGANWVVDVEGEAILRCAIYAGERSVFVSGDNAGYIRYAAVTLTTDQDWQGLGGGDFDVFGHIFASSYAKISGRPTFLLGGHKGFAGALIMASHDGITWNVVFALPDEDDTQNVDDLVWNAAEGSFFANVQGACWASADGLTWTPHASDFWDHAPGGIPDGYSGYDAVNDIRILPGDLSLGFMEVNCTAFADGIWMAGGSAPGGENSVTATSLDGGATWTLVTSGTIGPGPSLDYPVMTMVAAPALDMG